MSWLSHRQNKGGRSRPSQRQDTVGRSLWDTGHRPSLWDARHRHSLWDATQEDWSAAETLEGRSVEALRGGSAEALEGCTSAGALESWTAGALDNWSAEVLEDWSADVQDRRAVEAGHGVGSHVATSPLVASTVSGSQAGTLKGLLVEGGTH